VRRRLSLAGKFPRLWNRGFFWHNRDFQGRNREFHLDQFFDRTEFPSLSKIGGEHIVRLGRIRDAARTIANEIGDDVGNSVFAFPSDVTGERLSVNSMLRSWSGMGREGTMMTHGCRSSFRTWVRDRTNFPWDLAEMSPGRTVGSWVERAYARGDAFKKRVAFMQAWADFCAKPQQPGKVIPLQSRST
jgi:hypothetical protein